MIRKQKTRAWLLSLAAVLLLLLSGQNLFAQFDPPLELLWEVQNIGKQDEQFAVSPDESIFVATHQKDSTATIRVYDMANGTLLRQFPAPFCWKHFVLMNDNRHLAITGSSCDPKTWGGMGKLIVMDLENGILTDSLEFPDTLKYRGADFITISPDGKYLAISINKAYSNSNYVIYNTDDWSIATRFSLKRGNPNLCAFSPDSKYFFFNEYNEIFNESYFFEMLNMETKEIKTIHKADNSITDIKFSKDSTKMLFARGKKILGIYHFADSKLDTFELEENYDYPFRTADFIDDRNIILTTRLGLGIFDLNKDSLKIFSSTRFGIKRLFQNKKSFFYAEKQWAGVVLGLDKISSVNIEENIELLYPNPSTNILTLPTNGLVTPNQIQIFDLKGQKVNLESDKILIMNNEIQINVSNLEMGTYFLTVQNGTKQNTYKFIVGR